MEELGDEEKDEELEQKNMENRKRKGREESATLKVKGLKNAPGWKERSEVSREDERWKRLVEKEVEGSREEKVEKIPLPESFDLGLDIRGKEINSSVRKNHNLEQTLRQCSQKVTEERVKEGTGLQVSRGEAVWAVGKQRGKTVMMEGVGSQSS